ncbi:MAG: Asp-tRNA(Asn)/Glu-tRNA(Gln) amidotransferase subunit GatB, partial [Exilispira sp.]
YQITQYETPIGKDGYLTIFDEKGKPKKIGIERVHMEEDTGEMLHDFINKVTYIDYNRSGIPLIEIVSKPEISNAEEALNYLKMLKRTLEFLNISDCSLESGSMRCDINISVNRADSKPSHKVEIKNLNSFNAIKKSIEYEIERQTKILNNNDFIITETRLFNTETNKTETMRTKELAADYRYFREPDIPDIIISEEDLNNIKESITERPEEKLIRFMKEYNLNYYISDLLTSDKNVADYFEKTVKISSHPLKTANIIITEIFGYLNQKQMQINEISLQPEDLGKLIKLISENKISEKAFKENIDRIIESKISIDDFVEESRIISDDNLIIKAIEKVLEEQKNDALKKYLGGKESVFMFLVGQVMRELKGSGQIDKVKILLKEKIDEIKKF